MAGIGRYIVARTDCPGAKVAGRPIAPLLPMGAGAVSFMSVMVSFCAGGTMELTAKTVKSSFPPG